MYPVGVGSIGSWWIMTNNLPGRWGIVSSWTMKLSYGHLFGCSFFPNFNQRRVQSLASQCLVMEVDGRNESCFFPSISEEILQLNIWWKMEYQVWHFGIIMDRDQILYWKGLRYFHDIWDPSRDDFLEWEEARIWYSLTAVYHECGSSYWSSANFQWVDA